MPLAVQRSLNLVQAPSRDVWPVHVAALATVAHPGQKCDHGRCLPHRVAVLEAGALVGPTGVDERCVKLVAPLLLRLLEKRVHVRLV